jgi:transposase
MKILDQLDELNLDSAAKTQVAALVQALLDQVKMDAETLQAKDLKIQALILELAHLRRLRYGIKNEALSGIQRDLFEETCTEDIAELVAEVEQAEAQAGTAVTKPKRPRAGRQPLPAHLPRIEHRHEPESCQCGRCGKDLVKTCTELVEVLAKTSPSNWMSSPPSSLSIATFVRNMLAATVKPSRLHRFLLPSSTVAWPPWVCWFGC